MNAMDLIRSSEFLEYENMKNTAKVVHPKEIDLWTVFVLS